MADRLGTSGNPDYLGQACHEAGMRATLMSPGGTVLTVQTVQRWECTACGRTIYAQGAARIIEAARAAGGKDLVEEYLTKKPWLLWRRKVHVNEADVALRFDEYARTGTLRVPLELNDLDVTVGLREIKVGVARFPFFELTDSQHPVTVTRVTHGFTKGTDRTPLRELSKAKAIMDLDKQQG
jgi:hypothetical protein